MKATIAWVAGLDQDDELHLGRWLIAVVVVLIAHAAVAAAYLFHQPEDGVTGADAPALMIDFAPEAAAPESVNDLPYMPAVDASQASMQPEARQQAAEEPIIDLPDVPAPDPDIVIPPKKDEVAEKQEVAQPKPPEPVEKPMQQQLEQQFQQETAPKTEKRAKKPVGPQAGTTDRKAIAAYAKILSLHLQRFKRSPRVKGSVVVSFTVDRSGKVLDRKIFRSSGSSAADDEALAMITRAQPMPAFPAAVTRNQETFLQTIRFR